MFLDEACTSNTWHARIKRTIKQVTQIFRRITNRARGVKERELRHFIQAFIHSRIYGAPYHSLTKTQLLTLERLNNEARRIATGLPRYTPIDALNSYSMINIVSDLIEVQMHTQVARLQSASAGRDTLARLEHNVSVLPPLPQQSPSWECISLTDAKPLPRNMGNDQAARRRAYAKRHGKWLRCLKDHSPGGEKSHVFYTNAACIMHLPNFATAWVNEDGTSQGRKLHITKEPGHSTGSELHAILDLIKHLSFQRSSEDRSLKHIYHVFTDSQEAYRACDDAWHTSTVVSHLRQYVSGLRTLGHDFTVHWIPGHSGIPGNERANRLARALLQSAQSGRPSSEDDIEHETDATNKLQPKRSHRSS